MPLSPPWPTIVPSGWCATARSASTKERSPGSAPLRRPRRRPRSATLQARSSTPGLVDPHTHIVYGEEGLVDFEVLSQGGQRWDLEPAGGGVGNLVKRTRLLSEEALYAASRARMSRLIANGVTTVESKSGAGLDRETELRTMRVSRALGRDLPDHGGLDLSRRPRARARVCRPARRLRRLHVRRGAARSGAPGPGRPGRRLLRQGRLQPRADGPAVRQGRVVRPGREAARRPVHRLRRRRRGRPPSRPVGRSSRIRLAGHGARHGRGRHGGDPAGRRALLPERDAEAAGKALPRARRADGARHQLQPGELAHRLAGGADAPCLFPLPADARGGAEGLHGERGAGARPAGERRAFGRRPLRRPRGVGHRRSARHRLCHRRRALPRRDQGRPHRARGARSRFDPPNLARA